MKKNQIEGMNADCVIYYCKANKYIIWTLGYFGGGSAINIAEITEIANRYAKENDLPFETIVVEEIQRSRRFKYFKMIYSKQKTDKYPENAEVCENAFDWLFD